MSVSVAPISDFETNVRRKGKAGRPALDGERYPSGQLKPIGKREGEATHPSAVSLDEPRPP